MKIQRNTMISELDAFARAGHGLVTGEPGAGKTHSVVALHDLWEGRGFPHIVVPVERLGSVTDAEIRAALGIPTGLIDHVERYFAAKGNGAFIIDGFDSARSESTRERVVALIREAIDRSEGQWTVIVTVRIFDATRSHSLRNLFRDTAVGPPAKGIGIGGTRNYRVPELTAQEVEQGIAQIAGLREICAEATEEFRELLRTPFNLWLVEQILASTRSANVALSAVASEVQLLGLYWERRIESGDHALESRHVLSRMVERMVASHALSVRMDDVYDLSAASVWDDLLSAGVVELVGSTQQRFAFAHNTLFDYAVSILLMDDDPRAMHDFIAADFGRPLFLRPSITFYYTRLWYDVREAFWQSTWETLRSDHTHVRLVGRLVPPAVIVREARFVGDLEPAIAGVRNQDNHAREVILRVMQAIAALNVSNDDLWAEVGAVLARQPEREYAWNIATTGHTIAEKQPDFLDGSLGENLGLLGRRMLRWALQHKPGEGDRLADGVGALWALPLVCRTFATEPAESEELLRHVLSLLQKPRFPIQYFTQFSDAVGVLAPVAPALVGDLYRAVYSHAETSEEETSFGTPILPLRSTRRQDFGMCEYILDKEFDGFLQASPQDAIEAALDAFSTYVVNDHIKPYLRDGRTIADTEYHLSFRRHDVVVAADYSAVWLHTAHPDSALSLLRKVLDWIKKAADAKDEGALALALDAFARHARVQAAWVELLEAGAAKPDTLGQRMAELSVSRELQRNAYHELVSFVAATAKFWTLEERGKYQESVEALYRVSEGEEEPSLLQGLADRLATAIARDLTGSPVLLQRREALEASNAVPTNDPPFRIHTSSRQFTNEDWLSERGVDVQHPSNRALLDAASALDEQVSKWKNKRAPARELTSVYDDMEAARELLGKTSDAPADVVQMLATRITSAAGVIAEGEGDVPQDLRNAARAVLLKTAYEPLDVSEERSTRDFDMPAWSPIPQTEAAQGLPWLIVHERDEQVLDAIEHLATSPEPSVRFLIATEVFRTRWNAEERFWKIVEHFAATESSKGVLAGLMHSLGLIKNKDATRIAAVLDKLSKRGLGPDDRSEYAEGYVRLLAWLAFNVQDAWAVKLLEDVARAPLENLEIAKRMGFEALTIVTPQYLADARVRPMSLRAVAWIRQLLAGILEITPGGIAGEANAERAKSIYSIVDDVAARIYYNARGDSDGDDIKPRQIAEYFEIVRPVVAGLIEFGNRAGATLLAHTAHHLMEFLHLCLPLDPRGVLRLAADVVTSSERAGYNLDSLAVREVVGIAEELLADHRASISEGESLEDFVRLLDSFANNGWPEALRLIWRIDAIFR